MKAPVVLLLAALVSACAPAPTIGPATVPSVPTQTANPTPATTPVPSPQVFCDDLAPIDCPAATSAVLVAAAGRNGNVTRVALGRGVFCPTSGMLFANNSCPGGAFPPPEGGQWIGHALVTFYATMAQAYINIAKNGQTYRAQFIALATPDHGPS